MKCVFKLRDLQMFGRKLNIYMSNFHPLNVVGCASETQLQVAENSNMITWRAKGQLSAEENSKCS